MVKTKYTATEIKEIIKKMAGVFKEKKIAVDKIILYGSYAKGNQREHSDVDVAIISPYFKGKKIIEIQAELAALLSKYLSIVEPVGFSSDDFYSTEPETMLGEIKKHGKVLYSGKSER